MLTKQEYLDKLIAAAYDGTFPSVNENRECVYRGPNGKRCAVGIIIPDEKYHWSMENCPANSSRVVEAVNGLVQDFSAFDLKEVQRCHDRITGGFGAVWSTDQFIGSLKVLIQFQDCDFSKADELAAKASN